MFVSEKGVDAPPLAPRLTFAAVPPPLARGGSPPERGGSPPLAPTLAPTLALALEPTLALTPTLAPVLPPTLTPTLAEIPLVGGAEVGVEEKGEEELDDGAELPPLKKKSELCFAQKKTEKHYVRFHEWI